jgi:hypothetical protein
MARASRNGWRGFLLSRKVGVRLGALLILIFLGCMSLQIGGKTVVSPDESLLEQEGCLDINANEQTVYYPIPYQCPPNLEIKADLTVYTLVEQRADRFIIRFSGLRVQKAGWKAKGVRASTLSPPPPLTHPEVPVLHTTPPPAAAPTPADKLPPAPVPVEAGPPSPSR